MAWIESHQALRDHPKVMDLSERMGWSLHETIGKLHLFWWWCVDYALDGDLRKYNDTQMAGSVGLAGDRAKEFVAAMVAARWLDRKPYFRVHDWWDYAGRYLQVRFKHNPLMWKEIQYAYQNAPKNRSKGGSKTKDRPTGPTNLLRGPVETVDSVDNPTGRARSPAAPEDCSRNGVGDSDRKSEQPGAGDMPSLGELLADYPTKEAGMKRKLCDCDHADVVHTRLVEGRPSGCLSCDCARFKLVRVERTPARGSARTRGGDDAA